MRAQNTNRATNKTKALRVKNDEIDNDNSHSDCPSLGKRSYTHSSVID